MSWSTDIVCKPISLLPLGILFPFHLAQYPYPSILDHCGHALSPFCNKLTFWCPPHVSNEKDDPHNIQKEHTAYLQVTNTWPCNGMHSSLVHKLCLKEKWEQTGIESCAPVIIWPAQRQSHKNGHRTGFLVRAIEIMKKGAWQWW